MVAIKSIMAEHAVRTNDRFRSSVGLGRLSLACVAVTWRSVGVFAGVRHSVLRLSVGIELKSSTRGNVELQRACAYATPLTHVHHGRGSRTGDAPSAAGCASVT